MKKKLLLLLLVLKLSIYSQVPTPEAFELVNSLPSLWNKENSENAIKASKKLNDIYQPLFISIVHDYLSQIIQKNKGNGNESKFLSNLYLHKTASVNKIIEPIYKWNSSFKINSTEKANSLLNNYYLKLSDSTNYKSRAELYGLLIIKEFDIKKIGNSRLKARILNKIISNLSTNPLTNNISENNRDTNIERAYYRFLLAYSYNLIYDKNNTKESIENVFKYRPSLIDIQNSAGYSNAANLLINGLKNINFTKKYVDFLTKKGERKEVLNILLEEAFQQPTDENLINLKNLYNQKTTNQSFQTIWFNYLSSRMENTPELKIQFEDDILDLTKSRKNWIFIDVWGTWCGACRKKLPEFNKAAKEHNNNLKSKIKFYSFSFNSKNLKDFMNKNNYTFPVVEINKHIISLFKVLEYPTNIIITPNNKYLKIPTGVNWKEYIKNYILID